MTIKKALMIAYLGLVVNFLISDEVRAQQLQQAGLVPGAVVQVRYIWFRDSGAVGGGFWLSDTGTIVSISDTYVVLDEAGGRRHVIRWGAITFIEFATPKP